MGLDQYMWQCKNCNIYNFKKEYPNCKAKKLTVKTIAEFADGETETREYTVEDPLHDGEIFLPVAYWRKANAIHGWILRNTVGEDTDDCRKVYVEGKKIRELVDDCKAVLADHDKAKELLPVTEGFFFGSYEYDEYYFDDLKDTVKMLEKLDFNEDYIYQASW